MQKKNSSGPKSDDNHTDCDRIFARAGLNFRTYSILSIPQNLLQWIENLFLWPRKNEYEDQVGLTKWFPIIFMDTEELIGNRWKFVSPQN